MLDSSLLSKAAQGGPPRTKQSQAIKQSNHVMRIPFLPSFSQAKMACPTQSTPARLSFHRPPARKTATAAIISPQDWTSSQVLLRKVWRVLRLSWKESRKTSEGKEPDCPSMCRIAGLDGNDRKTFLSVNSPVLRVLRAGGLNGRKTGLEVQYCGSCGRVLRRGQYCDMK